MTLPVAEPWAAFKLPFPWGSQEGWFIMAVAVVPSLRPWWLWAHPAELLRSSQQWERLKTLWAEAGTECPLYMRAYQSGNSLECCTTELLPPYVCVAAQESVYIVSLSTEINNVEWQITRGGFFFSFFLIGLVERGKCLWLPSPPQAQGEARCKVSQLGGAAPQNEVAFMY